MSFEELNLEPEVVEALAAGGIETPTPFQAAAVPVIARGNDVLGRVGPGAGALVGYAAPLLSRLEGGAGSPCCIVLCTGHRQATDLARSIAPVAEACGHRAAALTDRWALPERADMLFVPSDAIHRLFSGEVALGKLGAVVLHDGDGVLQTASRDRLDALFQTFPPEAQRIICGQPFGRELASFADGHSKRAVTIPPRPTDGEVDGSGKRRRPARTVTLQVAEESRLEAALDAVVRLLDDPSRHVLVFTASEDQAADVGDFLSMHGFHAGAPGDESVPVWLAVDDEWDAGDTDPASIATLSYSVPSGHASALKRHETPGPAVVIAEVRELGHMRGVAEAAGFELERIRSPRPVRVAKRVDQLTAKLGELVGSARLTPYYLLVEALLPRFTASEIAAAALLQLDEAGEKPGPGAPAEAPSWVRLFVSAGERDQIGPRELLGAVTGETGIAGNRVGRIDVRESHSLVEVRKEDARKVIEALNGTTLGGRAVRVDYDRGKDRRSTPGKGRGRTPARR